jgi:peptidoglycan/LPS O-acetylase OafA/YrhL
MNRINKLDGLRGLFALFVVLFHFNKHNAPLFIVDNFFVRESYIFVDFFFILSGYVITLTYNERLNTSEAFLTFLKKRFIRLYPLLLFSTLMYWGFVHPHFNNQNIWLALDTLLLTNATPLLSSGIGMNYPSWSISSEMISYLLFGLCSIITIQKRKPVLLAIITIGSFILLASQQNYFQTGSFGFVRGLACFNLGYFIYLMAVKKINLPNQTEWFVFIGIIALMYFHYNTSLENPISIILLQLLIPIAFASSILVLIKTNGMLSQLLQAKPFLFLGKISYSVYLNHAFVIGYFIPKLFRWIQFTNGENKKAISTGILLIVLILYSWGTHYFIETRMGKKIASFLKA